MKDNSNCMKVLLLSGFIVLMALVVSIQEFTANQEKTRLIKDLMKSQKGNLTNGYSMEDYSSIRAYKASQMKSQSYEYKQQVKASMRNKAFNYQGAYGGR